MKHKTSRVLLVLLSLCLVLPLALGLVACSGSSNAVENAITDVTLKDGTITVKAALTKTFLSNYGGKEVFLFELPSRFSANVVLDELEPIASTKPAGAISLSFSAMDGVRSRLYASYVIASYSADTQRYTPLTSPYALSNPSAAATDAPAALPVHSIKGLIADCPADAIRLGASHTVVDVAINELLVKEWSSDAYPYVWNGKTAYVSLTALEALDETVKRYTDAHVQVYLRLVLTGKNDTVPACLYAANPDAEALGFAVNMNDAEAAAIMEGFLDFMADRYATPAEGNPIAGFIMGYRVNHVARYATFGGATLADVITNYEKLVRLANTAMKSHNPAGRVYISLDNHRNVGDMKGGWDISTFLTTFAAEAALRGDYDWHVAAELYAGSNTEWVDDASSDNVYYTTRNISTLTDTLSGESYRTPAGESRRLLISGLEIPAATSGTPSEADLEAQAASYVYTYMTALANGKIEALIYSAFTDASLEAPFTGLWSAKETNGVLLPDAARPLVTRFRNVDTPFAGDYNSILTDLVGQPYLKLQSTLAGKSAPKIMTSGKVENNTYDPDIKKATTLFSFNEGSTNGFDDAGMTTFRELRPYESIGRIGLYTRFDRVSGNAAMGTSVSLSGRDILGADTLYLHLFAGPVLQEGADAVPSNVTLRLFRPATGTLSDGNGDVIYETTAESVSGESWQSLSFDVSAFTKYLHEEDEVILAVYVDGENGNAYQMGISSIAVRGVQGGGVAPWVVVVIIIAIILVLTAGVFVFLYFKNRSHY